MPLRAEEVPDEFVRGDAFWGKVHYTTQLRVDPRGHILYWTTDLLTSAKESSKRALHPVASGQLCPYVFFDEIVDVRVTEEIKDDTTAQFSRYRYSMTVITNKDFVSPRMWPFRHLDKVSQLFV
ncbi:hypothetical protein L596_028168 [Steinernema carpocapsae]|uniref:Uncharacterized protein n=1 Tax=Steinernema carpocapsae TaxID=34508 RepID=A0A4V5ZXT6_STECR|nr:hypothetical protein L596_028168 [Steinernema carpocapsae]